MLRKREMDAARIEARKDDCARSGCQWYDTMDEADAALAAIKQAGYVVVPAEPTEAMVGAEAERKTAYNDLSGKISGLSTEIQGAQSSLPTKETVRNWVLTGVALMVALVALVWQVFGIGGDVAGNFADRVLESERKQQQIIEMLEERGDDNAS